FNPPSQLPPGTQIQGGDCTTTACTVIVPLREPPNDIFNFTTVTVGRMVTVRFRRNLANTPVYILAQGDVTVSGVIDVSGGGGSPGGRAAAGGPGGYNGGLGGVYNEALASAGSGLGPGGGISESVGSFVGIRELLPLVGGGGGGGGRSLGALRGG